LHTTIRILFALSTYILPPGELSCARKAGVIKIAATKRIAAHRNQQQYLRMKMLLDSFGDHFNTFVLLEWLDVGMAAENFNW
jgi:hypothetical protein